MRIPTLVVTLVLVFAATSLAFDKDKEHKIYGKNYDRHAVERLLDESITPAEAYAGATMGELRGKFPLDRNMPVEDAVLDFIDRHRNAFGLKDPNRELKKASRDGLSFQQAYIGIPIWQHTVNVHLDEDYDICLIQGNLIPTPDIDTTPLVSKEEAVEIALNALSGKYPGMNFSRMRHKRSKIRNETIIYEYRDTVKLAYHLTIIPATRFEVYIDAKNGDVIRLEESTAY